MNHSRQIDIFNPRLPMYPVTIIGCGGIGSPTAVILAKMGCKNMTLIDPDIIEEHNLPNQFFRKDDVNSRKVDALKNMLLDFSDCSVKVIPDLFQGNFGGGDLPRVVISGIDTMAARKNIWSAIRYNVNVALYIDGRTGGEILQILTIRPSQREDVELYERFLFSDKEVLPLPCGGRAIFYTGAIIGGLITAQFKKWRKKEKYVRYISYDLKTMSQITKE